jgi:hypothetical protein
MYRHWIDDKVFHLEYLLVRARAMVLSGSAILLGMDLLNRSSNNAVKAANVASGCRWDRGGGTRRFSLLLVRYDRVRCVVWSVSLYYQFQPNDEWGTISYLISTTNEREI